MNSVIAIAGRPNTGKTTLFNALTGLRQRVANFAGCTVEKASGTLTLEKAEAEIVDLPGTFSIVSHSQDEEVAFRFLAETSAQGADLQILCVAEASNLHNDLALALSLRECGYRVILVVNMIDEARHNGISIDASKLAEQTGLPVFLASARHREGLRPIQEALGRREPHPGVTALDILSTPHERLHQIHEESLRQAEEVANRCSRVAGRGVLPTIARSMRIDRWLFHPVVGPVVLAAVLFLVFQSLFTLGNPLQDGLSQGLNWVSQALRPVIPWPLLASLVCDGVIAGVSAVASFVPQIAILFALIGFLEHSGYLPRAGAMVDRALRPFGLDGKVFIPFLSSFACAIPGIMAARTISNERRRLVAVLLSPLMTCSARLPVYGLIIAAFVPASFKVLGFNGQGIVMAAMYALGIVAALILALALRWTSLYEAHPSPVTVLPPYRLPKPKELGRYVWTRCWHFLSRAGKVIFTLSVLLWALGSFPRSPNLTAHLKTQEEIAAVTIEHSALGRMGHIIEPVFRPIGYDWKLSVAVLSSLAAREVFVGTLGTLFALSGESEASEGLVNALRQAKTPEGLPRYTLATAVSLLLFFAIALQCVSTIAVVRRETGSWRWPLAQFAVFFVIAYALSWAGFRLTSALL